MTDVHRDRDALLEAVEGFLDEWDKPEPYIDAVHLDRIADMRHVVAVIRARGHEVPLADRITLDEMGVGRDA